MPADLKNPFDPSCCEGGAGNTTQSCQPCGCDKGANHMCQQHYEERRKELREQVTALGLNPDAIVAGEYSTRQFITGVTRNQEHLPILSEVRVVDPVTGGEKGSKLSRFDLIPAEALVELANHFGRGARKYEDRNWERGYKWSLSFAALNRHLWQWWHREEHDEETGTHHIIAVAWHAFVLFTFWVRKKGTDDRP